eukprot:6200279-Pleurochrysis_carterae.AAC.2
MYGCYVLDEHTEQCARISNIACEDRLRLSDARRRSRCMLHHFGRRNRRCARTHATAATHARRAGRHTQAQTQALRRSSASAARCWRGSAAAQQRGSAGLRR